VGCRWGANGPFTACYNTGSVTASDGDNNVGSIAGRGDNIPDTTANYWKSGTATRGIGSPSPDTTTPFSAEYWPSAGENSQWGIGNGTGDEGLQIIQRLSWYRDENDFRYEVIIEQQDETGEYTQIVRQDRTENFIELSLAAGRYRYRVSVYNLLDRLEYSTNWANFSIDRARPPVLDRMNPNRFILTGKGEPWIIELKGTNLLPESELSLRPVAGGDAVLPAEYTAFPDGKSGRVVFNSADLAAGRYELRVRNPGGFEARGECTVKNRLSFDLFISASYAPALPFYGYLSELFDNPMYPLGFSLRADFLPLKGNWGSLGLEALVSWTYLSITKTGLTASAHLFLSHLNLLYQYTLSPQLALDIRLGERPDIGAGSFLQP
jgi:hypothetical protein